MYLIKKHNTKIQIFISSPVFFNYISDQKNWIKSKIENPAESVVTQSIKIIGNRKFVKL